MINSSFIVAYWHWNQTQTTPERKTKSDLPTQMRTPNPVSGPTTNLATGTTYITSSFTQPMDPSAQQTPSNEMPTVIGSYIICFFFFFRLRVIDIPLCSQLLSYFIRQTVHIWCTLLSVHICSHRTPIMVLLCTHHNFWPPVSYLSREVLTSTKNVSSSFFIQWAL